MIVYRSIRSVLNRDKPWKFFFILKYIRSKIIDQFFFILSFEMNNIITLLSTISFKNFKFVISKKKIHYDLFFIKEAFRICIKEMSLQEFSIIEYDDIMRKLFGQINENFRESWKAFHSVSSWSTSPQNGLQLDRNRMNVVWSERHPKIDDRDVHRLVVIYSINENTSISNGIIVITFQSR